MKTSQTKQYCVAVNMPALGITNNNDYIKMLDWRPNKQIKQI